MIRIPDRVVIYPSDVMNITGKSYVTSKRLLSKTRKHFNKKKGTYITAVEFCNFTGIKLELVQPFLKL